MQIQDKRSALLSLQKLQNQLQKIENIDGQLSQIHKEIESKKQWIDQPDEEQEPAPPSGYEVATKRAEEDKEKKRNKVRTKVIVTEVLAHVLVIVLMFAKTFRAEYVGFNLIAGIILIVATWLSMQTLDGAYNEGKYVIDGANWSIWGCELGVALFLFFLHRWFHYL